MSKQDRKGWMSTLAKAPPEMLDRLWTAFGPAPKATWLRRPEIGAVMVRGRMGGTGRAFNLGEMTVTRASVQLESGAVGHGYVKGRDKRHAEQAALIDALMQGPQSAAIRVGILQPIEAALAARKAERAAKAAATRVEFFTMARGEDA